ncbi:MAG: hypothetical protein RJB60_2221 [Pseudomonadota bacterium]|jgi:uncharacterized membrane protein YjgN (DUF898 family)
MNKAFEATTPGMEPTQERQTQRYPVQFTGSGSEYFRIWIVNLLLTLLTLGLYYPWAKVRKLKYFYSNTEVAGHALDFHGTPKQMLRGFLLMAGLFLVSSLAGKIAPALSSVMGLVLAAAWPALLWASMRFRLANTSWRGLRFEFKGSLKGAYAVFGKAILGVALLGGLGFALMSTKSGLGIFAGAICFLGIYAMGPYVYFGLKRYQHQHYAYAQLQTEFRASFGDVLKVFMRTGGLTLLIFVVAGIGAALLMAAGMSDAMSAGEGAKAKKFASLAPLGLGLVLVLQFIPAPYFQSRMQNLVWNQTGNPMVRFKSDLGFTPLFKQTLLNWVLIIVTLGLYWPFALVATTRLKLQAITVHMRVDPDTLVAQAQPKAGQMGIGDAAADLAGFDLGL